MHKTHLYDTNSLLFNAILIWNVTIRENNKRMTMSEEMNQSMKPLMLWPGIYIYIR